MSKAKKKKISQITEKKPKPKKRVYLEDSIIREKPDFELRLVNYPEEAQYQMIERYLFERFTSTRGNKSGTVYRPGLYMEPYKPDLEQFLIPETDEMYVTLSNSGKVDVAFYTGIHFNKSKYASIPPTTFMNPDFIKRLSNPAPNGNQYKRIVLKRSVVESCIKKIKDKERAVLMYFLNPTTNLEECGIPSKAAKELMSKVPITRTRRLPKSIDALVREIITLQEGLR